MLRAVVFDMDGLLIDSEPLWVRAEIEVFGGAGVPLTEDDCALTKGLRVDDVVAYWHARRGFDAAPADVEARLVARVVELVRAEGRALPGVESALAAARSESGRRIALASSSPTPIIEATLQRLGLTRTFDVVASAENEAHGKPHPAIFLRTAARLGVSPLECVVVEDSMTGVIAAKAARMKCIAVPSDLPTGPSAPPRDARFVLADAIVASLAEMSSALLERVSGDVP
ncbi:MAG: hexitol phosphatase HxpB [Labilithrix sp.]|nr:hexitol phosphatase HxpB [Labilithrix sp.]MBX3220329.1 hexitol phosphatase HxpB [Labilithrix sp.]